MLQSLFRAEKLSRGGLVKLALVASISLFYFQFCRLTQFLLCFLVP